MEEYLNKGIKEIIAEFPAIGTLLEEFDIGCVPCNVGTCLLKDIVEVHNLSSEQEASLMYKMSKLIYPDREISMPAITKTAAMPKPKEFSYSPPMKILVDEHKWIERFLAIVPALAEKIDIYREKHVSWILEGVDFIRSYADKFHHAKEEDILFKYFDEKLDIIQVMRQDHTAARNHVKAIIEALEDKNKEAVVDHLNSYQQLLVEHIKKEDEILYPWMDRNLTISQVGELYSEFQQAEQVLSVEQKQGFKNMILKLEDEFLSPKNRSISLKR
ncbi:MAG: hemerythrin domain-containing protein [bacterium]|nr:hemerythrin domain-containing protein [bacterium]